MQYHGPWYAENHPPILRYRQQTVEDIRVIMQHDGVTMRQHNGNEATIVAHPVDRARAAFRFRKAVFYLPIHGASFASPWNPGMMGNYDLQVKKLLSGHEHVLLKIEI